MYEGILIQDNPPPVEEAMKRYESVVSEQYDPPLTEAELAHIKDACLRGGTIILRCTFAT